MIFILIILAILLFTGLITFQFINFLTAKIILLIDILFNKIAAFFFIPITISSSIKLPSLIVVLVSPVVLLIALAAVDIFFQNEKKYDTSNIESKNNTQNNSKLEEHKEKYRNFQDKNQNKLKISNSRLSSESNSDITINNSQETIVVEHRNNFKEQQCVNSDINDCEIVRVANTNSSKITNNNTKLANNNLQITNELDCEQELYDLDLIREVQDTINYSDRTKTTAEITLNITEEILQNFRNLEVDENVVINNIDIPIVSSLEIFPKQISLFPEDEYQFTVKGYDYNNNEIIIDKVKWKSSKGGKINSQGIFKGGYKKRQVLVTAVHNKIEVYAQVVLLPVVKYLEIIPDYLTLKPAENQQFICRAIDQYRDIIEIDKNKIIWEAIGGQITSNGFFTVDCNAENFCTVTATYYPYYGNGNVNLLNVGISLKILSYITSLDIFQYCIEEVSGDPEKTTSLLEATFSALFGDEFNFDFQTWLITQFIKYISSLLNIVGNILISQSEISASATIIIIRYIDPKVHNNHEPIYLKEEDSNKLQKPKRNCKYSYLSNSKSSKTIDDAIDINLIVPDKKIDCYEKIDSDYAVYYEDETVYNSYLHCPEYYEELLTDNYTDTQYKEYLYNLDFNQK